MTKPRAATPPLKTPKPNRGWKRVTIAHAPPTATAWRRKDLVVYSDHCLASNEWLVSVSAVGRRASDDALARVRRDFEMELAEEDSPAGGVSRQLWLAAAQPMRAAC